MSRPACRRCGFSLAELLLAIGIILILCMVTIIWQHRSYGHSRSNACRNNLRNLSLAVIQYEANRGNFPGYREDLDRTPAINPNDDRSWVFAVLPYLDQRAKYEELRDQNVPNELANWQLEICLCPSSLPQPVGRLITCNFTTPEGTAPQPLPADHAARAVVQEDDLH